MITRPMQQREAIMIGWSDLPNRPRAGKSAGSARIGADGTGAWS